MYKSGNDLEALNEYLRLIKVYYPFYYTIYIK